MGWRDWVGRVVVVQSGWGVGETQYRKPKVNSLPMARNITSPGLYNVESTVLYAENNNFVGCKAVANYSAENNAIPLGDSTHVDH